VRVPLLNHAQAFDNAAYFRRRLALASIYKASNIMRFTGAESGPT